MTSTIIAEITRGGRVESVHTGAYVVADAAGGIVASGGDAARAVFPRSAIKIMQAIPLLLGGAADRFGLDDAELALACASHTGTPLHAETARRMLEKAGREPACLECGTQWPTAPAEARALAAGGGTPSALHNNCSGKHAGFVCSAVAAGHDPAGYVQPGHPTMRAVTRAVAEITGQTLHDGDAAIDGCSMPSFAMPLRALAQGFARIATGTGLPAGFADAASRLRRAVARNPLMIAGEAMFDTLVAQSLGEALFLKGGAEGVCCGAIPGLGLGFALKCDDGASRGAEAATASLLRGLIGPTGLFDHLATRPLTNWNGIEVGRARGLLG